MSDDRRLAGGPADLAGLVAWQEGSVVSRELLRARGGTITLFAFAPGQAISEHSAPFEVLLQGVAGTVEVTLDGQPHQVAAGEVLHLPAGVPHGLRAEEPCKVMVVMLREAAGA